MSNRSATRLGLALRPRRAFVKVALGALAASALGLVLAGSASAITPSSSFTSGDEGWTGLNVPQGGGSSPTPFAPLWPGVDGISGPFIWFSDEDSGSMEDLGVFLAPAAFAGDASANYGGTISFDLRTNGSGGPIPPQVLLLGSEEALYRAFPSPAPNSWTTMSATIDAAGGWTDQFGQPATQAEFASVLSGLGGVAILADVQSAPGEATDVDNVSLTEGEGPPPTQIARALTLKYHRATHRFKGLLSADGAPDCAAGQLVKVLRKRGGPDQLIGKDRTSGGGQFSVRASSRAGTYYAQVAKTEAGNATCLNARSASLRLRKSGRSATKAPVPAPTPPPIALSPAGRPPEPSPYGEQEGALGR